MGNLIKAIIIVVTIIFIINHLDTDYGTQKIQSRQLDYKVSANYLLDMYEKNEVSADVKCKGKIILVSGTVTNIGKDPLGISYITIGGTRFFGGVRCHFSRGEEKDFVDLQMGQEIGIIGLCEGKHISVSMKGCRLSKQ